MDYIIHTDGSCFPNPGGPIGYGFTLKAGDRQWSEHGDLPPAPENTNNMAEFEALYRALGFAAAKVGIGPEHKFICYSDSQIMVNLMSGLYNPNPEKSYYQNYCIAQGCVKEYRQYGAEIGFHWIPREQNQEADDLSKAFQPAKPKKTNKIKKSKNKVDIWDEMS